MNVIWLSSILYRYSLICVSPDNTFSGTCKIFRWGLGESHFTFSPVIVEDGPVAKATEAGCFTIEDGWEAGTEKLDVL